MQRLILATVLSLFVGATAHANSYTGGYFCIQKNNSEYCVDSQNKPLKGEFVLNSANGLIAIGKLRNGRWNGKVRFYNQKGQLVRISNFNRGRKSGREVVYYANGKPRTVAYYRNGNIEGSAEIRNINGETIGKFSYHKGTVRNGYCLMANRQRRRITSQEKANTPKNTIITCGAS